MRNIIIAPEEHYHILNRGNNKQPIFLDDHDRARFLFLILYFQSSVIVLNVSYHILHFMKHSVFNISRNMKKEIFENRYIDLVNFALMPNHFHLTIQERKEGGTARYMQRVLNGYTKYFNAKYKKSGHLFQGPYKAIHISHDRQLLYLSAYIHSNPKELQKWSRKPEAYPWSSYQDYTQKNRRGSLLQMGIITEQFPHVKKYRDFVETSGAKKQNKYLGEEHYI
ncbi:MAG: transposase [bacterium]|nr:transposase [bacterium]